MKIIGKRVVLREKCLDDAHDDYRWETDPELAELDATRPVNMPFSRYRLDFADELRLHLPTSRRFAVDTLDGKHIGNCAYYNISERNHEAELGIMIGERDYWDKGYGVDVVATLLDHIFAETKLDRVYLKTLANNFRAQTCFKRAGFKPYVRMIRQGYDFLFMEVRRREWKPRNGDDQSAREAAR